MRDFDNNNGDSASCSGNCIDSSNIGFQLLKKHGWKEGTGLGASQQGRLEPIRTFIKKNKRGLGAEKKKKAPQPSEKPSSVENGKKEPMSKKEKALSKRMRKMLDEEKRRQEKEFERAFFREFWPENV